MAGDALLTGGVVVPPLGEADVHVWTVAIPDVREIAGRCLDVLSADERERRGRMLVESRREAFTIGRGLLRALAGMYGDVAPRAVRFSYGPLGKPGLEPAGGGVPLQFSVSHSGTLLVLAFTREAQVGVDVERIRATANAGAIAERFFTPWEQAALAALDASERVEAFFACWTRKEALLKGAGVGISGGLAAVEVTCHPREPARLRRSTLAAIDPAAWTLFDLEAPAQYRAAVAVALAEPAVTCFTPGPAVVPGA